MRIILAEDTDIWRKSLSFFLKSKGFEVDHFLMEKRQLKLLKAKIVN